MRPDPPREVSRERETGGQTAGGSVERNRFDGLVKITPTLDGVLEVQRSKRVAREPESEREGVDVGAGSEGARFSEEARNKEGENAKTHG